MLVRERSTLAPPMTTSAAGEGGTLKLGCCSWSYHRSLEAKTIDFSEWLRICAQDLRVGGVDIIAEQMPKRTRAFLLETKKRCTDAQLTIISLSPGNDFGKPTAAARQAQVDSVKGWIDAAFILGAPCLRIFSGWPPKGQAAALWPAMVRCIRQVAAPAAAAGITLVIEPHNHGGFLPDSKSTLKLIRELDSPWVRINLDTGNYLEPDPYAGLEASMPYAPHVVAKIHHLSPAGQELEFDYDKIFAMLKRHRYHGFVTLEYEGKADELEYVPKAIAMLRRYAKQYAL